MFGYSAGPHRKYTTMNKHIKIYIGAAILLVSSIAYGVVQRGVVEETRRELSAERTKVWRSTSLLMETQKMLTNARNTISLLEKVIKTTETRPDGTVVETVETIKENTQVSEETSEKETKVETVIEEVIVEKIVTVEVEVEKNKLSRYSLALHHPFPLKEGGGNAKWLDREIQVVGGVRLGNWPVFVEAGYVLFNKTSSLGGRYEW